MTSSAGAETADPGRVRRVSAVVLSLVAPGAGHFLLGAFRRGAAWAVGLLTVLGLSLGFATTVSLLALVAIVVALLGRVAAALDAARIVASRPSWMSVMLAWAVLLVGDLALVEPLKGYYRTHYARAFTIPSSAMQPTLLDGDNIVVDMSAYRIHTPERGDIVVFAYPPDERLDFIKRVVALPGEQVLIRGNQVSVNGRPLREPYVNASGVLGWAPGDCGYAYGCEPTTVPPDSYFVMGDNRDDSQDSRDWGFVRREKIKGRAVTVYWSWDSERGWPRFDRIGRSLVSRAPRQTMIREPSNENVSDLPSGTPGTGDPS